MPSAGASSPLDMIECNSCEAVLKTILQKADRKSGMTIDALCAVSVPFKVYNHDQQTVLPFIIMSKNFKVTDVSLLIHCEKEE